MIRLVALIVAILALVMWWPTPARAQKAVRRQAERYLKKQQKKQRSAIILTLLVPITLARVLYQIALGKVKIDWPFGG